jgi:hypothetical protein
MHQLALAVAALAFLAPPLPAQQGVSPGRIRAIDAARSALTVRNGNTQTDGDFVVDARTKFVDAAGHPLTGGLGNAGFQVGARVRIMLRPGAANNVLAGLLLVGDRPDQLPALKVDMTGVKPLCDMVPGETYRGFEGGLYPGGSRQRPPAHEADGLARAARIEPLGRDGRPDPEGKIVVMSVGMSNAIQAFSAFMKAAQADADVNPRVLLANAAQGSMTADLVQDVEGGIVLPDGSRAKYWARTDEILEHFGATREQVQVAWIKEADRGPDQGFPTAAKILEGELANIVRILHERFENLKLVYLSSRTYAGWARIRLNPEPYAYESGFAIKWLIERQTGGDRALNCLPSRGEIKAPWLSWGPYLWANGTTPRSDGFRYEQADFSAADGTHESPQGQEKIGKLFLDFFKTDTTTRGWFLGAPR